MSSLDILQRLVVYDGVLPADSCFSQGYLATDADQSLYLPTAECVPENAATFDLGLGRFIDIPADTVELVWVNEASLEDELLDELKPTNPWGYMDAQLNNVLQTIHRHNVEELQHMLDQSSLLIDPIDAIALYRTSTASLFAFRGLSSSHFALDSVLSPIHKATVISFPPTPLVPVPADDVARVRGLISGLSHNKSIAHVVDSLSIVQMHKDITYLTGEAVDSFIESRHSFHPDTINAAQWISTQIESTGASCELRPFLSGFAPNVICRYNGTEDTNAIVLLSAHYDSRGSYGSTRAPGGDDDGSGTVSVLSIARTIGKMGITFKSDVELCLFAGEEQGLLGSKAYSRELREADANITLMIQADMLAYHKPGEPPQLGLPDRIGTPEVAQLVANISFLYSPELEVGFTPACCSDHQSFHEQGFAATQVFERAGPIADPLYHNSGDLSLRIGYDLHQTRSIGKVQFATLLHAAGFDLPA
ncbi:hypothetical protein EW145_g3545 [Phellinidium pouzarii]|uniref:Peptide hydrolase n=1 Tax=Phellinidium pouzarii TaxID=167371 RepID=A0A4S4L6Z9_9AGAM|nr:hypothetical protein EW145_g3545 [Phellinidium pouzarii]